MNEENAFIVMMENVAGLACIYFTGGVGILKEKAKKTRSEVNG